ncbi:MAG: DUF481 domain-containing protein [Acidobacteria bacterium]|nr:DUF481 domain-containing protein [Acidobacteriota bacterium]
MNTTSAGSAVLVCVTLLWGVTALAAAAPAEQGRSGADDGPAGLRVFLDCGRACDRDYLRREITFVDYVRDRRDAQVHVLVTTEDSGGGTQFTLDFIGLDQFEGNDVRHAYPESRTDTDDETRAGIAQVLRVGFLHYVIETPLATLIEIGTAPQASGARSVMTQPEDDPWNFWVYRLSGDVRASGEDTRTDRNFDGSASANRTTDEWIVRIEFEGSYNESVTELSSGDFTNVRTRYDMDGQLVKSLGDHWGASIAGGLAASTFLNQDRTISLQPGIEFNVFPYSESSRRSLTLSYEAGVESFDYEEETLFDKLEETVPAQELQATLDVEQPWGDSRIRASYNSVLNDVDTYSASVSGNLSFRIARGLSLKVSASTSVVRDQFYLPKADLPDEEILLERRQLATDSRYRVAFGFSYTFGSIFNNVVNPRF